jgi:5-formyltetrahydrofolate cyclo-ligase
MTTPRKQVHTESSANRAEEKQALRRILRARRAERSADDAEREARAIAAVGLELPRLRRASCVALYASIAGEPGTAALRAGLHELGVRVLLPVVGPDPARREMGWAEDVGDLVPGGPLGLPEPAGPRFGPDELARAEVVVVPALAVDTSGTRLGRGRGYYDAALRRVSRSASVLALVHDDELLDAGGSPIPAEPHDVPVAGILTPSRWMFLRPGRSSDPVSPADRG